MKRSRFIEQQIAFIFKQSYDGTTAEEICRKVGISIQKYYRTAQRYRSHGPDQVGLKMWSRSWLRPVFA
jgi:transposase